MTIDFSFSRIATRNNQESKERTSCKPILCLYRARSGEKEPISGVIEDIDSGQKEFFNDLIAQQTMLADSIVKDTDCTA